MNPLCELPPEPPRGRCAAPAPPALPPIRPSNPPGMSRIGYRIGTFDGFRTAMVTDLADLLPGWQATGGDYGVALVELWAYLADVLTLYQEQIANEAFLPTATQRDSLARMAELVGYRPAPGAAASALLAFTVGGDRPLSLPAGLRTSSRPAAGRPAAVFETGAGITARPEHSAIRLATLAPADLFAPIQPSQPPAAPPFPSRVRDVLVGLLLELDYGLWFFGNLDPAYYPLFLELAALLQAIPLSRELAELAMETSQTIREIVQIFSPELAQFAQQLDDGVRALMTQRPWEALQPLPAGPDTRRIALQGAALRLQPGDFLLIADGGRAQLRQLTSVQPDHAAGITGVTFVEDPAYRYRSSRPQVYALRVRAAAFGAGAPLWKSLSPYLTQTTVAGQANTPAFPDSWDEPANDRAYLPSASPLILDRAFQGIAVSSATTPSLVVIADGGWYQVARVTGSAETGHSDYTLTARATSLTLDADLLARAFGLRGTMVLARSEPLELYDLQSLPASVTGDTLVLDGSFPAMHSGQQVIVADGAGAEDALLAGVSQDGTTVRLRAPLQGTYTRAAARLLANVVPASQGETVREEVLGSGDGSAWQQFALQKTPLTYVQAGVQDVDAAVQSTLQVTVNGVLWQERRDLRGAGPNDRVFFTTEDDSGRTLPGFGDGVTGVRLPTGRDNVRARYRWGQGTAGNMGAGAIRQLVDSLPGLRAVSNPEPASGGADRETPDEIRVNAPGHLRTLGRAVSLDDYAALALRFPGVRRARAAWVTRDDAGTPLPHPTVQLTVDTGQDTLSSDVASRLRRYLDAGRDPNVPLRVLPPQHVDVLLGATVNVLDDHGRRATLRAAQDALGSFFTGLGFGESVHLGAVYTAFQRVEGVRDAAVTGLHLKGTQPAVEDHIAVPPTGMARAAVLAIQVGQGGFED